MVLNFQRIFSWEYCDFHTIWRKNSEDYVVFRDYQIKLALAYLLTSFFKEYGHESRGISTRFCKKIQGLSVISSLSNQTCTISSYFLYFWCFQSKFTTVYPLILLIFRVSSSMSFRHQIKLAPVYLIIFCIFDVLKTNLQ